MTAVGAGGRALRILNAYGADKGWVVVWRPRRGVSVLAAVLGLVGVGLAGLGMLGVTVHAAQPENGGLALFGEMMQECHTAGTAQWRLAPRNFSFVAKDNLGLCRQIRRTMGLADAGADGGNFVNHLATDDLIGVGFVGQGGIGAGRPFAPVAADPPPMTRPELVAAANHWSVDGQAKCATVFYEGHDFRDSPPSRSCTFHHDSWRADGRADAELDVIGDTHAGGMYVAWAVPQLTGVHHAENGTTPPNCKPVVTDAPYSVRQSHGGVSTFGFAAGTTNDPNGPKVNHVSGQLVTPDLNVNTPTTIQFDLSRDP